MKYKDEQKCAETNRNKPASAREPLDYVEHMMLYEAITGRNDINVNVSEEIASAKKVGLFISSNCKRHLWHNIWPLLKNKEVLFSDFSNWDTADCYIISGIGRGAYELMTRVNYMQAPCYTVDENFIRSVLPVSAAQTSMNIPELYLTSISLTFDARGVHFFSGIVSQLEYFINSSEAVSESDLQFADEIMNIIISNKISKYNCQALVHLELPENNRPNILVVDQSYRDFSVVLTGADDDSFGHMLQCAIAENPGCNIIVKTHIDTARASTYFSRMELPENVFLYSQHINPLQLLGKMDKVYCYSSTMGWEALMLGKEVHVFGSPIYAGWGMTHDKRNFAHRRTQKRTLRELFYYFYIRNSLYLNPQNNEVCPIYEALDFIIHQRDQYLRGII